MRDLEGRVAIISGGSSGIGAALARAFARERVRVALLARREGPLRALAQELAAQGVEVLPIPTDVTQEEAVQAAVDRTVDRWGRLDIVVANAGQYVRKPVTAWTVEDFQRSCAVNFYGALHLVLAALPVLRRQREGHIVLMSSLDAKKGLPLDGPYVAAKYALSGIGGVMRQELRDEGIDVTVVYPGRVDTPMIANLKVPWISPKLPPEKVARAVLKAIRKRKAEVIVPWTGYLLYLDLLAPRLADYLVKKLGLSGEPHPASGPTHPPEAENGTHR
ncbi:MAG: SDR family NAD(P)-dependent oxidoreductase [Chloroflexi bacterium]|nr:SDR family NAD(P)-dependent oxidoreductase [Chloroflexota bacterium]